MCPLEAPVAFLPIGFQCFTWARNGINEEDHGLLLIRLDILYILCVMSLTRDQREYSSWFRRNSLGLVLAIQLHS